MSEERQADQAQGGRDQRVVEQLAAAVGPMTGPWLVQLAQGRSSSTVVSAPYIARSCSRETTFQQDLQDWDRVWHEVAVLVRRVADDLADGGPRAVRVVVKFRYAPFITRTHGRAFAGALLGRRGD